MLVIGTSAGVSPAGDSPLVAKRAGATIVEVNVEETPLTRYISHWLLKGSASLIRQILLDEIMSKKRGELKKNWLFLAEGHIIKSQFTLQH